MTHTDDESSPPGELDGIAIVELPSGRLFLDLGNGEAWTLEPSSAADHAAMADYLSRHYPDDATGPRFGPWFGPVLNMGAHNALAAYRLYAGKIPPTALNLLVYMATVSLDKDAEPSWWEGHETLAIRVLGYPEPVGKAGKGAVERAVKSLLDGGAITTTRHASGHAGRVTTVRYRLWLESPAPEGMRQREKRRLQGKRPVDNPVDDASATHGNRGKQDGQLPTETVGSNGQLPTVSVAATHGNRGTKEEEEDLKQERDNTGTAVELTDVEGARARFGQDRFSHWRDPQETARQHAAASQAARKAAERAEAAGAAS